MSTGQLIELGFAAATIADRVRLGKLHRVERGVYAVGHDALAPEGRRMAALLYAGRGAVLSHLSAAVHWGLLDDRSGGKMHVTVARRARGDHNRTGGAVSVHGTRSLSRDERTRHDGVPVTAVPRTLLDLAGMTKEVSDRALRRAVSQALVLKLTDARRLRAQLSCSRGRRGVARLAGLLDGGIAPTRSVLEDRLLALVRAAKLPEPRVNAMVATLEVDLLFAAQRVIVEADGARYHDNPVARLRDVERQVLLEEAGYQVVRVNWSQVTREPARTARRLRAALAVTP